jgi:hypothetical protein
MTALFLVDALILASGTVSLGQDIMFGYGALVTVYMLAILELFGFSVIVGTTRSFLSKLRSTSG